MVTLLDAMWLSVRHHDNIRTLLPPPLNPVSADNVGTANWTKRRHEFVLHVAGHSNELCVKGPVNVESSCSRPPSSCFLPVASVRRLAVARNLPSQGKSMFLLCIACSLTRYSTDAGCISFSTEIAAQGTRGIKRLAALTERGGEMLIGISSAISDDHQRHPDRPVA